MIKMKSNKTKYISKQYEIYKKRKIYETKTIIVIQHLFAFIYFLCKNCTYITTAYQVIVTGSHIDNTFMNWSITYHFI